MSDDVIDFAKAKREAAGEPTSLDVRTRRFRKPRECPHTKVTLYEADRLLECRDCESPVDPMTFILQIAHQQRRFVHTKAQAVSAQKDLERTTANLVRLKRDEANCRARLKRLKIKLGPVEKKTE